MAQHVVVEKRTPGGTEGPLPGGKGPVKTGVATPAAEQFPESSMPRTKTLPPEVEPSQTYEEPDKAPKSVWDLKRDRFLDSLLSKDAGEATKIERLDFSKQQAPLVVQTLIFPKDRFTREEAVAWAQRNDRKSDSVDETEDSFRLRQMDPDRCAQGSERTFDIPGGDGVKAVGCHERE